VAESINDALTANPFPSSITFLESTDFTATSYEDMIDNGFSAKSKKDSTWSKEETALLKKACKQIQSGEIQPQVKDYAYYISHYVFHGTKSKAEVEGKINEQIRAILDV
jgi:hypothetical protein